MAWEWVAPVATGASAVVSTVAVYLTAQSGRRHAELVARDGLESARYLAHQERVEADRSEAYREALTLLEHFTLWGERISPALDTDPPAPDPDGPNDADQVRVRALLDAHGSPEVLAAFERSMTAVKAVASAVRHVRVRQLEARTSPPAAVNTMEPWDELEDKARPLQKQTREELISLINAELRTLPPDPVPRSPQLPPPTPA